MAKINLLPWRVERRRQREREFYMMLGGAALAGILAVMVWYTWMGARIDNQVRRNKYLTAEIHVLNNKLKAIKNLEKTKSQLLARKQIIEKLQANRAQMVHLFDELVKTIPDSVRLDGMSQKGSTLTLKGVAQSNASVATYMRDLDKSPWMTNPYLHKTEENSRGRRNQYAFSLSVKLTSPEQKAEELKKDQASKAKATANSAKTGNGSDSKKATPGESAGGKP